MHTFIILTKQNVFMVLVNNNNTDKGMHFSLLLLHSPLHTA